MKRRIFIGLLCLMLCFALCAQAFAETAGEKNALKTAKSYLSIMAFSHDGLIGQLEFEGFSREEAAYAADHCGADWNEQAAKKAAEYLKFMAFSTSGLIGQLEYEGFTHEQAVYGAENCSGTSTAGGQSEQAAKKAREYLKYSAFSYSGLIAQLEYEGFSTKDATEAVDNCGADWNEQAAKKAESYLKYSSFTRSALIDQLKFEGFTAAQAEYGVKANGL